MSLLDADLEFKLQTAAAINNGDEECARYLIANRERLLPEMLGAAERNGEEVDYLVARFVRGVHARHLAGALLVDGGAA
jgi:hypothetical protein